MPASEIHLSILERHLTLRRYPLLPKEFHRAWDAADELAAWFVLGSADAAKSGAGGDLPVPKANHRWPQEKLNEVGGGESPLAELFRRINTMSPPHCLVVNDNFGCLTLLLATLGLKPWVLNDSWCAMESLWQNAIANDIELDSLRFLTSQDPLPEEIDLVLMRAAGRHDERERIDQLLQPNLAPNARIITAAMLKANLHSELGPTLHSSIWRKACLHLTVPDMTPGAAEPVDTAAATVEHDGLQFTVLPGVFSGRADDAGPTLDPGTAFLLSNLPAVDEISAGIDLIDLGCGTGVLGIVMAKRLQTSGSTPRSVRFFDESALAVECTRLNAISHLDDFADEAVSIEWLDCLTDVEADSADLVLCNPPFHAGNVRTDAVAWRMFTHVFRVLRKGGRFRLVGNRHLHYHAKLSKIFGNHKVIASDSRYVILDAVKGVQSKPAESGSNG